MHILEDNLYHADIKSAAGAPVPWERFCGKTILITGATGMIASVIIDILMYRNHRKNQNTRIIAISRSEEKARARFGIYFEDERFVYLSHDMTKPLPDVGAVDYILHAASNTHPRAYATDPIGTIMTNVSGTKQLLDYAVEHGCERFLLFSSVEVYGENKGDVDRFDEGYLGYIDCNTTRSGYPEGKRVAESLCNAYYAKHGQEFVIGRFSRVYGPTGLKEDSKAIAQFIQKAVHGEDIVLKSEGNQLYSYTYVVDAAVAAFYLLLLSPAASAVNVVDEESDITLKDLAACLAKTVGRQVIFELPDAVEKAGYSTATKAILDGSRLKALGWKPATHIKDGLQKTVQILKRG